MLKIRPPPPHPPQTHKSRGSFADQSRGGLLGTTLKLKQITRLIPHWCFGLPASLKMFSCWCMSLMLSHGNGDPGWSLTWVHILRASWSLNDSREACGTCCVCTWNIMSAEHVFKRHLLKWSRYTMLLFFAFLNLYFHAVANKDL